MSRPENTAPDFDRLVSGLRAHVESLARSGVRLAAPSGAAQPHDGAAEQVQAPCVRETLEAVQEDLGLCTRCPLCEKRKSIVFGQGSPQARLVFVGGPSAADDDAAGTPFSGAAGELLTRIIRAIGLERTDVYITHIVKCAPPDGRPPSADEIGTCLPFLQRQLEAIGPAVVCALGQSAAGSLLGTDRPLEELRGRFHRIGDMLVMPTYEPAYLLAHEERKRETWEDMKLVLREYQKAAG